MKRTQTMRAALSRATSVLVAGLVLVMSVPAGAEGPTVERQASLDHLLRHDCGSCHGMTLKGGLGPSLRPEVMKEREEISLQAIILDGVPGTPMPPWRHELSPEEVAWLVRRLRQGDAP